MMMSKINRKPAYTVAELESDRQRQKLSEDH